MINIIILVSLLKILALTNSPMMCAGIYTGVYFVLSLLFGASFLEVLIYTAFSFGFSFLYFWALNKTDGKPIWWIIMIVGLLIGLI